MAHPHRAARRDQPLRSVRHHRRHRPGDALRGKPGYVRQALARHRLAVQSFETDDAHAFHTVLPHVPIGILDADRPTDTELLRLSRWADQINPQYTVTDQALVDRVHRLGMDINVWTVDEPGASAPWPPSASTASSPTTPRTSPGGSGARETGALTHIAIGR